MPILDQFGDKHGVIIFSICFVLIWKIVKIDAQITSLMQFRKGVQILFWKYSEIYVATWYSRSLQISMTFSKATEGFYQMLSVSGLQALHWIGPKLTSPYL